MHDIAPEPASHSSSESLLERQLETLIESTRKLRVENQLLRQQQKALVDERARLVEKVERARVRIEAIMSRLRTMEARP